MHDHKWFPVNFLNGVGYNFVQLSIYYLLGRCAQKYCNKFNWFQAFKNSSNVYCIGMEVWN